MIITEAAIIVSVVGWFLSPNIKELMDWARSHAGSSYKWHTGLQEKLEKLADALEEINCLVGAARAAFVNDPTLIGRLWRLKDAIHDAEELLDTFEYQILEANLKKSHRDGGSSTDSRVDHGNRQVTIGNDKSLEELNKLLKRLERLCNSSWDLFVLSQRSARPMSRPISGPMPRKDDKLFFGYHEKYNCLVSSLTAGDDAGVVVAIIGHGGTGKTELARRAFNDEKGVRAKFDLLLWVCVYGKFTETELLREIWNSAAGARPVGVMNVTSLQLGLAEILEPTPGSKKRCLLVLDDVCNDESAASVLARKNTWDKVLAPFKQHGGPGSRVLMTTRAEICSTTLGADARIVLNGIGTAESTRLLKRTALGNNEDAVLPLLVQDALENNIGKLLGSPLAAEGVGCMLEGIRDQTKWKKIMSADHRIVLEAHLSSYQDLSPQLQRCFAFCSIFPKKWNFQPQKLTKMWIALGFVEPPTESGVEDTMEDMALSYFDALVQRSLFQEADKEKDRYVIHEHIHSMLRLVCPAYYLIMDGSRGLPVSARTVRHLSVTTGCLNQLRAYPDGLKQLRTLIVFNDEHGASSSTSATTIISTDVNAVLNKFKGVRVLDFSHTCITEVPESTGELKHLRYLGLPKSITKLDRGITNLLLLQTLGVIDGVDCTEELQNLPIEINRLINLRHLCFDMKHLVKIGAIGNMEKLQGSIEFEAKKEPGHGLRELEKLNSLRETLSIKGLDKVPSKQEAESAQLANKEYLKTLKLEWGHYRDDHQSAGRSDLDVLEGLQPHPCLKVLHIERYRGTTSPSWLEEAGVLQNLRSLHLRNCNQLLALPLVGRLPLLKVLEMKGLHSVQRIDHVFCGSAAYFRALETIVLDDMPELEVWDASVPANGASLFPQLRKVQILDCNKLSSLSALLSCRTSLSNLRVERCENANATFFISRFPRLNEPKILKCPHLKFV